MKPEPKTIAGVKYVMTPMGAYSGNTVVLRLLGPFVALLAAAAGAKSGARNAQMAEGVGKAVKALAPKDLRFIVKALAGQTRVFLPDGNKLRDWPLLDLYDAHFAGRYDAQFEFIRWGIEMNHFFDGVLALARAQEEGTAAASSSPPTSTGSVGVSSSTPSA